MTAIPCSEFQRAFSALGVTHLVAPSPQAKGKIERRFGTLQKRLVAILAYEKVSSYAAAQLVLAREVQRQNATLCRTTGLSPNAAWEKALAEKRTVTRPCPPATLLDLHLALHLKRRVNADHQIDFLGQSWHIAPTQRASITHSDSSGRSLNPQAHLATTGPKSSENTRSKICPLLNSRRNPFLNSRRHSFVALL